MQTKETFASAAQQLWSSAIDGAVGGAVCGAALGVISMVVFGDKKNKSAASAAKLPVAAPHIVEDGTLLQTVLDLIACVPPSAQSITPTIVATIETLCVVHEQGCGGGHRANLATAQRALNTLRRAVAVCVERGGRSLGIEAPAEELFEQCEDMLHNMTLD